MNLKDALELAEKLAVNNYTKDEAEELRLFLQMAEASSADLFMNAYYQAVSRQKHYEPVDKEFINRLQTLHTGMPQSKLAGSRFGNRWLIAAALLAIIAGTTYYLGYFTKREAKTSIATVNSFPQVNILPGSNRALLTLADGTIITLDSAGEGNLIQQGNTQVIKTGNGMLAYKPSDKVSTMAKDDQLSATVAMNTVSTPRGGQYQIVLPDGSRVWLNAASSIRFPTSFSGKERKVTVTGESYFEVAANNAKPFIVMVDDMEVKVLGTSFNVNAYEDEKAIKTTLVTGAVNVSVSNKTITLQPGQQASVKGAVITTYGSIDINQETAWKKGLFIFNETPIEPIMRQLARWYNLKVVYEGKVNDLFVVTIPRNVPVSQVLEVLQLTKAVHFKIDGNRVTVSG